MELAVIGTPEFTLGFRLAGITRVEDVEDSSRAEKKIAELMADKSLGILITDEKTMDGLSERTREEVESSVQPVAVVVSTEAAAQEAMRKMIIKSIGVDLWKQG